MIMVYILLILILVITTLTVITVSDLIKIKRLEDYVAQLELDVLMLIQNNNALDK